MKKKINEILSKYNGNKGYTMHQAQNELFDLFNVSNSVVCPSCSCNKLDKHLDYYTCLNKECDFGGKL